MKSILTSEVFKLSPKTSPIFEYIDFSAITNVKNFGAVGDGIANDTPAIQDAINHVHNNGGGIVFIPPGQYLVHQLAPNKEWCIELKSNVSIFGTGKNSHIHLADNQSVNTRIFSTNKSVVNNDIHIFNLYINGNKTKQDPSHEHKHAIYIDNASHCSVTDCIICNTVGDGVAVYAGGRPYGSQFIDVSYNEMYGIDRVCINFAGASFSSASYNYIHDSIDHAIKMEQNGPSVYSCHNRFSYNRIERTACIALNAGGDLSNITISDIYIHDNRFYDMVAQAISISQVSNTHISNNAFGRAKGQPIVIRSSQNIIVANNEIYDTIIFGKNNACIKVHSGFVGRVGEYSTNIMIMNNIFRNNERIDILHLEHVTSGEISGNKMTGGKRGIVLDHNTAEMLIMKNNIDDNDMMGIHLGNAASGHVFRKNLITNNEIGVRVYNSSGSGNDFGTEDEPGCNTFSKNRKYDLWNQYADPLYAVENIWDNDTPQIKGDVVT